MIVEVKIRHCPNCESLNISRNGTDYKGDQKYHCHQCGSYGTLNAKARYSQEEKARVLRAYQERASMRGIRRIFGVVSQTLLRWIKAALEKLPSLSQTLSPARLDDVLEFDELWSFVLKKSTQRWIWMALCRRTRQVVAYYVGDRSEASCRQLWQRVPEVYKACTSYSDFWAAYQKVLPEETHHAVAKETGQTAHVERWNNTLRQRLARGCDLICSGRNLSGAFGNLADR